MAARVGQKMIVTSHRGAGSLEPENTLRAMHRAIALGVDQIETDVQITRDDHLILMHDPTVDRTTNGRGNIADLTFAEIRQFDAGLGERVPTLEEVLAVTLGKVVLQIELKGPGTALPVVQAVEAANAVEQVILTSFKHQWLIEARAQNPRLRTGALWGRLPTDVVQQTHQLGFHALHIWHEWIDQQLVKDAHDRGLHIRAWNTDKEDDMRRLINLGVDAIGSDRPDILLDVCHQMGVR